MNIKAIIIDQFAKQLVGGVVFESAKRIASALDNKEFAGKEKRELALKELGNLGYAAASWVISLAVELAVAWLRSKTK
jgi:hypothetical protein